MILKKLATLLVISLSLGIANASLAKQISHSDYAYSYHVFGKPYHVLRSAKNYNVTGIASWYGSRVNPEMTASGERYNWSKLTAASKVLPLSTRVLVTNLRNGKKVIVRINDRGPFVSNRVIDLSYAAAAKIGIVNSGLARVSVKSLS